METSDAQRIASEHGLNRLTAAHLEQFASVTENGRKLAARLPKDLHWSEEPAHVFRLTPSKEASK